MTHSEEEELDKLEQELQEELINESSLDGGSHFDFKLKPNTGHVLYEKLGADSRELNV